MKDKTSVIASIDWITIIIYICLLSFGWISVCGASYNYGDSNIFSLDSRSGMQIIWIGTSLILATFLLLLDDRVYDTFAFAIYGFMLLLLFATIFNPHEIKGSRSWLVLGPLRLQPAEFSKFATALAVAKFMSVYNFSLRNWRGLFKVIGMIMLPMMLIVMQKETGSALVYSAFFLMLYREGMTGSFLFTGLAMVIYFVVGIRFEAPLLFDTPTSIGQFVVLFLIQVFTASLIYVYCKAKKEALIIGAVCFFVTLLALLFSQYVIHFNVVWIQSILLTGEIIYIIKLWFGKQLKEYLFIVLYSAI